MTKNLRVRIKVEFEETEEDPSIDVPWYILTVIKH